jgi:DNA-binding transcriptional MerR regulator
LTLELVREFTLCAVKNEISPVSVYPARRSERGMNPADEILTGELARMCGVSADTIRHYERVGVLPAAVRGANGYRYHARESAGRVMLVRRAIAIGFSLAELARILRQRDQGTPPCRGVRALAGEKLAGLDRRIAELQAMRGELAEIVEEWDGRLAATREGEAAFLLEGLRNRKER